MKATGVDFVFYPTADFGRAMTFYRDVLGLKVGTEKAGVYAEFDLGNLTLMVGAYGQPPKDGQQVGGAIVALAVNDVAKAVAELKAKGVPIVMDTAEYQPCHIMLHCRKDGTVG